MRVPRQKSVRSKIIEPGAVHFPEHLMIDILRHACDASVFEVGGKVFRQHRGAFIGLPILAGWCVMSVMESEMKLLSASLVGPAMPTVVRSWRTLRYVDNLLVVFLKGASVTPPPLDLLSPDLYGAPVTLETEPDLSYVGLDLAVRDRQLAADYKVPRFEFIANGQGEPFLNERWRYRTSRSGGSIASLLCGMSRRLHCAARVCFPSRRACISVLKSWAVTLHLGYPVQQWRRLLGSHSRKYRVLYEPFCLLPSVSR